MENSADPAKPIGTILLDFLGLLTKWRKLIVWIIIIATTATIIVTLVLPKWYKATASVFPAEQTDIFSGLEGVSSLVKSFGGGGKKLASLSSPSEIDRYLAILKSENALLRVINKFDLTRVYDISSYPREKTMKELLSNVEFNEGDEGTLEVVVYDHDPQRAADMANYFLEVLNEINTQLRSQDARGNRAFIEQRYNKNISDLKDAEEAMKSFQLKYGVIAVPSQVEASIKAGAEISARLATKEIELNILKRTLAPTHPSIMAAQVEVDEIRHKLHDLETGSELAPDAMKILVPFRQTPQLAVDYLRLYRAVEIQNKILQLITPLYEQAKVEEQRSTPSVVVLDKATVPERKSKPKISFYALLAFFGSLVLALAIVLCIEGIRLIRSRNPESWDALWLQARSDWFGLRVRRK